MSESKPAYTLSDAHAPFDSVEDAIAAIAAGQPIIVSDDEDRENEGDLIMAASKATPETINLMIRHGSGIVCVPMLGAQLDRLGLGPMVARNREVQRTDFAVTVDAAEGISTGVSAYDRTVAIKILADPDSRADQLVQPGHVFPLRARAGGVLERAGHTEAAVDLCLLAGLEPCGILCELVNDDGTMQRLPQLEEFKKRFGLKMISIEQLIAYRLRQDKLVEKIAENPLATPYGEFTVHVYRSRLDQRHHLALTTGAPEKHEAPLVRVHSANVFTDVFHAGDQGPVVGALEASLRAIAAEGCGAVLYMAPMNPGEALVRRLDASRSGPSASAASGPAMDLRDYGLGAQMLSALGLKKIRLLTRQPRKVVGLEAYGVELVEQIELKSGQ
jgi:3,4-dihydroxy 2-butanone 4-phosphate synthase/GTP cyclohydrolase II